MENMHLLDYSSHRSYPVPRDLATSAQWRTTRYCRDGPMIRDDQELAVTQQRIRQLQDLLLKLRKSETAENYAAMAGAYLLDIDRMNEEVRSYLASLPREQAEAVL